MLRNGSATYPWRTLWGWRSSAHSEPACSLCWCSSQSDSISGQRYLKQNHHWSVLYKHGRYPIGVEHCTHAWFCVHQSHQNRRIFTRLSVDIKSPLLWWIYLRKHKSIFIFSIISQHWNGLWNPSSWSTMNHFSFLVNPLRATFLRWNINIYLHCISLLHID